ncbi:MAG: hypothetical protein AMXMBFR57_00220 [Acidimicrobiia bacterium]
MPTRAATWGLLLSVVLLLPGLFLPVITVRGVLSPEGLSALTPQLLDQGLDDETVAKLRPLLNPAVVPFMEMQPGGLRGALVGNLSTQLSARLKDSPDIEVYHQTRSIVGSVRQLYSVGSWTAATLILLFSVVVPLVKSGLAYWAINHRDAAVGARTLTFVERIAKWSMADVFAVALFITYLAAQASQMPPSPDAPPAIVSFHADFGAGFYWFAAYCVFSLAVQQGLARWTRGQSRTMEVRT